jgi:hypothetical protein
MELIQCLMIILYCVVPNAGTQSQHIPWVCYSSF